MNPHFTTSASPPTRSCGLSVSSARQVAEHPGGLVERADQVLALGRVDPGLAADRGVDHAEQRGRHVHDPDPAQEGRGDEAGQVGRRSAADADDRVGAGEARPARAPSSRTPRPRTSWPPRRRAPRWHAPRSRLQRGRRGSRDRSPTGPADGSPPPVVRRSEQAGQLAEQPVPDDDVVRRRRLDPDPRHVAPICCSTVAATSLDDLVDGRGRRSRRWRGDLAVERPAGVEQRLQLGAHVAEQQRPGRCRARPARTASASPTSRKTTR